MQKKNLFQDGNFTIKSENSIKKLNFNARKSKFGQVFYKIFCSILVLIFAVVPLFTFTACAENGTFYVGIMARRSSNAPTGDVGTARPDEMFLVDVNNVSRNILTGLAQNFGIYDVIEENKDDIPFKNYLNIQYDLTNDDIEELYAEFFSFNYFTYLEYSNATVQRKVLVVSNQELSKPYVEENIVSFDAQNGTFTSAMRGEWFTTKNLYKISGEAKVEIDNGDEMPINNAYRYFNGNGPFEGSTYAYVFIGNQIGDYSFSSPNLVQSFLQKFYDTNFASIEKKVRVQGSFVVNQPALLPSYNWKYSLKTAGRELKNFFDNPENYLSNYVNYYYKDIGVFVCMYLVTGSTDPTQLRKYVPTDYTDAGTLYDIYLDAEEHLFSGEYPNNDSGISDNREYFIKMCCQFLVSAGIPSDEDSEGTFTNTSNALFNELLGERYLSVIEGMGLDSEIKNIFVDIIEENRTVADADYADETSIIYFSDYFRYEEKEDLLNMKKYNSIMADFDKIQAIVFQSWEMSDTLDAALIQFEYYKQGESDEETEANKQAAWEILQNYTFSIRYGVVPEVGTKQIAQTIVLDTEEYVDQTALEEGELLLDLQTIFNSHFQEKFSQYSRNGFYLRDFNYANEDGSKVSQPFSDNFYYGPFSSGTMGVGAYYDGMVRDNSLPEYYVEIIFGAPSYNEILDIKIVDVFL